MEIRRVGEARKIDYELEFWLPVPEDFDPAGSDLELVMGGTAYVQRVEAKQRFISARIGRRVRNYASRVAITLLISRKMALQKFTQRKISSSYMKF